MEWTQLERTTRQGEVEEDRGAYSRRKNMKGKRNRKEDGVRGVDRRRRGSRAGGVKRR